MKLAVGDARIAYDDSGEGEPVLFVHAFPLDRTMWAAQLGGLGGRFRCIAPDLRGLGESSTTPPYSMARYADDVVALLDHLRLERAAVVGLSLGGYVAFALWRRHRARVSALVLADTRASADTEEARERRRQLIAVAEREGSVGVTDAQITGLLGKSTRARNPRLVDEMRRTMTRAPVEGIVGALEAMIARPDSTDLLATIDVPTLVVCGEEDALTQPKEMRPMAERIPGARFEIIAGAGHLTAVERPAAFNALLVEMLGSGV